jgi:hypothetical protein
MYTCMCIRMCPCILYIYTYIYIYICTYIPLTKRCTIKTSMGAYEEPCFHTIVSRLLQVPALCQRHRILSELGKPCKEFCSRGKILINPMPEITILNIHSRYFITFVYVFNVFPNCTLNPHPIKKL